MKLYPFGTMSIEELDALLEIQVVIATEALLDSSIFAYYLERDAILASAPRICGILSITYRLYFSNCFSDQFFDGLFGMEVLIVVPHIEPFVLRIMI